MFDFFASRNMLNWMSDEAFLKRKFKLRMGYELDLDNPKTFNEKLQWLKLYDRNPLYTKLVDKYEVRKYIAEKIGEEYLIPLVGGPWNSPEEIDFDLLPDQFVLKCTHDSGGVVICKDKSKLDISAAKAKLAKHLKRNYYWTNREWPYKNVPPRIIAEKYMEDYVPASAACPLADGAMDALEAFKAAGVRQVILSASNLDTLRRQTDERGVTGYFDRLLGLGDIYAKSKVEVGLAYLKENGFDPARAVMIGDSVHDYEVAQALGVRCVLQSGGHQPPEKLRETGAPVVKGLREAAALILE